MLGKAVGTKAALYEKVASAKLDPRRWSNDVGNTFEVRTGDLLNGRFDRLVLLCIRW